MDYVDFVGRELASRVASQSRFVVYGQNVAAGSRLAGLARHLIIDDQHQVINTPNAENSLVGMGFGLMTRGVGSMFLMKQLDFLFLGLDHLVNTWNALRDQEFSVPFVIGAIVVDSGWEGPQSGHNLGGVLGRLTRLPVAFVTGKFEATLAMDQAFAGGPSILLFSQREFRNEISGLPADWQCRTTRWGVIYSRQNANQGQSIALVACNFARTSCFEAADCLLQRGYSVDILSLTVSDVSLDNDLLMHLERYKAVVVVDDSKTAIVQHQFDSSTLCQKLPVLHVGRSDQDAWSRVADDNFTVDCLELRQRLSAAGV